MRSPLSAFDAFTHDASAHDAAREVLPRWLAVAKAAEQLSVLDAADRGAYLRSLGDGVLPPRGDRPTLVHDGLPAPEDPLMRLTERLRREAEQMERAGCFELAFTTVSAVCQLAQPADLAARMTATAHLGRIARQLGDLASANECYQCVVDEALRERDAPLAALGLLGLGNVAKERGNRPAERALYERALAAAYPRSLSEASASQGLMNVAIAERRFIDALLHGWHAYDLMPTGSDGRAMILSNLALTSLEADFTAAALTGFRHVLTITESARIRIPAIGGAMRAAARLQEARSVRELDAVGDDECLRAQIPYESARFLLYAGEAWAVAGDLAFARRRYEDARDAARVHGFHEVELRAETALAALVTREAAPVQPVTTFTNRRATQVGNDAAAQALVEAGIGRLEALPV